MFLRICHGMNRLRLSLVVMLLRILVHMVCAPFAEERTYVKPEKVGYLSTIVIPRLGAVAFRRMNGSLQYRW